MIFASIRSSLRRKAMLLLLGTAVAALALSAVGLVVIDLRAYERQWSSDLQAQADIMARATAPAMMFNNRRDAEEDLKTLAGRAAIVAAVLFDRDGRTFATYTRPESRARLPSSPASPGYRIEGEHLTVVSPVVERGERIGMIYLQSLYDPWTHLREYLAIIVLVMALSLVGAAFVSGWLQHAFTGPILEVASVAREVMVRRDFSLRARKTTTDEIGELVDAFNAMLAEAGERAEQLRDADRRKDEFLATLAHELRNPLAPLRNALEILRIAGGDEKTAAAARGIMERQVSQMVRLVDDLLDVSRITTGKLEIRPVRVDLQSVVRNAVETAKPFIDQQGHALELRLPPEPLPVEADSTRLAQVFSNLLHNAAKYTERGGRIELSAEREHGDAVIRVRDNGIGIDAQVLPSIFNMFVQADRRLERPQAGLGVGLSLARTLVELHGGRLSAHSDGLGRGSEFTVRIPLAAVADTRELPMASRAQSRGNRHRVLLADDNVDFITTMATLLSAEGHDVRVAHDGVEALEVAREFEPQFAFLDIGMPRMNGYDVARGLRSTIANCMLIAVTGWGQEEDRRLAREAGFDRHLVKPVDPGQIEAILANS
jgi:two-component system, sensor histidine kinase